MAVAPASRQEAIEADRADPLAPFVDRFVPSEHVAYLDGNSLGRLPLATRDAVEMVLGEWGSQLVEGWDRWIDLPSRTGDQIAALLGADAGSVIVADSVTVNLYKVVSALVEQTDRRRLVVGRNEFPTDRYVVKRLAERLGLEAVEVDDPLAAVDRQTAVVVASIVDFRDGSITSLADLAGVAAEQGAAAVADLSHAAGAIPIDLASSGVAAAVGCTYKYLCGGPGAPSYLYVRPGLQMRSPIAGWMAAADQFAMAAEFEPLPGAAGFAAGTPPILSLVGVAQGVSLVAQAGVDRLRAKSILLTEMIIEQTSRRLPNLEIVTPRQPNQRGGHVSVRIPDDPGAAAVSAALRRRGVVPDMRPPDLIRLGPAPASTTFTETWDAIDVLVDVISGATALGEGKLPRVP